MKAELLKLLERGIEYLNKHDKVRLPDVVAHMFEDPNVVEHALQRMYKAIDEMKSRDWPEYLRAAYKLVSESSEEEAMPGMLEFLVYFGFTQGAEATHDSAVDTAAKMAEQALNQLLKSSGIKAKTVMLTKPDDFVVGFDEQGNEVYIPKQALGGE